MANVGGTVSGLLRSHGGPEFQKHRKAVKIAKDYVQTFGEDFVHERQVEATFEIPAANCVITGAIDLLLHEDAQGNVIGAQIIDFKTMEGGVNPGTNPDLDWTELALQVQLYARAADQVLGHNAGTGSVHLLKDNQRVDVPIDQAAIAAAMANVEWAVQGILNADFPMRPHHEKCAECDFHMICPRTPQNFSAHTPAPPPALHLPNGQQEVVRAFSKYDPGP